MVAVGGRGDRPARLRQLPRGLLLSPPDAGVADRHNQRWWEWGALVSRSAVRAPDRQGRDKGGIP